MTIGNPPIEYIDGAFRHNNPIRALVDEAKQLWPDRKIGCIVSIGTGVIPVGDMGKTLKPLVEYLAREATNTQKVHQAFLQDIEHQYGHGQNVYFRFNVPRGLEKVGLEEWKELDRTKIVTEKYLDDVWGDIQNCVSQLRCPTGRSIKSSYSENCCLASEFVGNHLESGQR